jgi:hypothetical protein
MSRDRTAAVLSEGAKTNRSMNLQRAVMASVYKTTVELIMMVSFTCKVLMR